MADAVMVGRLKRSVADWNAWRDRNPLAKIDLSGVDFGAQELATANLSGIDGRSSDFYKANLRNADLHDAVLDGASFNDANLHGANLAGASCRSANLVEADARGANMAKIVLSPIDENADASNLYRTDLRETNLAGADLFRINLHLALLRDSNLGGATLRRAYLREADFSRANLSAADLRDTDLRGANLGFAVLNAAKLNGADLQSANLSFTDAQSADFQNARLSATMFVDANLKGAGQLQSCVHLGPSILDHRTLMTCPEISPAFLRGCGLPELLVKLAPDLARDRQRFHSCFLSYSTADEDFVRNLYSDLQRSGVRCWFAPEDLMPGKRFRSEIEQHIRKMDRLLVVISKESMQSQWVEQEVETALDLERLTKRDVLIPVQIDKSVLTEPSPWAATIRRTRQILDFSDVAEYEGKLPRLLAALVWHEPPPSGAKNSA